MSLPAKEFKISKKPLSNYIITPLSPNSQQYVADIASHGSTQVPYMFLHEGTSTRSSKTIAGSIRRDPEDSAFEINSGGTQDVGEVGGLTTLTRTGLRSADMEVGMATGKPRDLAWRNGGEGGSLVKLLDLMGPDTVLAVFEEDKLLGRGGKLKLNVDWGLDFERLVIISFLHMFEKSSVWGRCYASRQEYPALNYKGYAPGNNPTRGDYGHSGAYMGVAAFGIGGGGFDCGGGGGGCDGGGGGGGC